MDYRPVTALRHVPKQHRGERKVEKLLRSAEMVFAEVGYENATTNLIAAQAGVPIGSLYQFFASKDAILEAVAQRYLDQTRAALVQALETGEEVALPELLADLVETLVKLQEQRPYFLQCLAQNRAYAVLRGSVQELHEVVTQHVARLLQRISASSETVDVLRRATVCVHTVSALLPLALDARGRERAKMIQEIVTLLHRYLEPELKLGRTV